MTCIPRIDVDPCGRLRALEDIRDQLDTGALRVKVEFESADGSRRSATFGQADPLRLDRLIRAAKAACDAASGRRRLRRRPRVLLGGL